MTFADALTRVAAELALFSAVGFFLFAINDLVVDFIYFVRRLWRSATIFRRFPKAFGQTLAERREQQRLMAIFVPAWDESAVIASMLRSTVQRLDGGGRSDFALFAEGGLYRQPLPWRFSLDAYAQAGIVGLTSRDLFADGALAVTRPVYGRFSAGFGLWGGFQPGIYRIDAGPRVSVRLRNNIYAHFDWRQRLAGTAQPASGPALTLAADF